jgi:hypothetical protein
LGLADVLTDTEDKRICYENALKINKNSRAAKEGLRNLEPQANPLVAALGQQAARRDEEELFIDEEDQSESEHMLSPGAEVEGGPPTFALVAIGLLLSVVVFAIGSGAVFFLITSMTGG